MPDARPTSPTSGPAHDVARSGAGAATDRSRGGDRRLVAVGLIVIGLLALLGNLGLSNWLSTLFGVTLFTVIGLVALTVARRTRNDWVMAAAFPAFGLALAVLWTDAWAGAAFLASLSAGFLSLYFSRPERWWALIPAGVLATLSVVALSDAWFGDATSGVVFFLGLALTFAILARLSEPQPWAVFPAAALGLMALVVSTSAGAWLLPSWLLPVLLIAGGVALLLRAGQRTSKV